MILNEQIIFNSSIRHNNNFNAGPTSDIDDFSYESDFFGVLKDTTEYKFYKISKFVNVYAITIITLLGSIFVFLLIFSFFKVDEADSGRALLIGILLAIVFRIAFISVGIEIIEKFHWVMYLFGIFLL